MSLNLAMTNLRVAIEESGATITHDPLPSVTADPTQLTQLFQNLVGNAVKFRGTEPPRIHVTARPEMASGSSRSATTGLASPQNSASGCSRSSADCTALTGTPERASGWPFAGESWNATAGRFWVESGPGKGSTFHFTLGVVQG